jgi:hypothetical protein
MRHLRPSGIACAPGFCTVYARKLFDSLVEPVIVASGSQASPGGGYSFSIFLILPSSGNRLFWNVISNRRNMQSIATTNNNESG